MVAASEYFSARRGGVDVSEKNGAWDGFLSVLLPIIRWMDVSDKIGFKLARVQGFLVRREGRS